MTFEDLVIAILHEQDCKTHYFQEGEEGLVRLHQKYRAEAIEQLRNWIAAQVAAERERCAKELDAKADGWWAVFLETQDREASKSSYQFRVAAGVIRARGGE